MRTDERQQLEGMFATFLLLNGAYDKSVAYQPQEYALDLSPIGDILKELGTVILETSLPALSNLGMFTFQRKMVMSSRLAKELAPYYQVEFRRTERRRFVYYDLPPIFFSVSEENEDPKLQQKKHDYVQSLSTIILRISKHIGISSTTYCERIQHIIFRYMVLNDLKPHEVILFFGHRDQFERLFLLLLAVKHILNDKGVNNNEVLYR